MVTAWADPELVARAMDRGAVGYIRKPFDIMDMRDQVGAALAGELKGQAPKEQLADEIDQLVADQRDFSVVIATVDAPAAALDVIGTRFGTRLDGATGGRWSDGTFVFVAPDTGLEAAGALAERLRASLADRPLDRWRPTVSLGVAERRRGEAGPDLLSRAAKALRCGAVGFATA